jgi:hypothetical protein
MGSESSPTTNCELGVPQGSVLEPILFSIFVSPVGLLVCSHQVKHQQYADDTQLYFSLSPKQPHLGIDHRRRQVGILGAAIIPLFPPSPALPFLSCLSLPCLPLFPIPNPTLPPFLSHPTLLSPPNSPPHPSLPLLRGSGGITPEKILEFADART